jgi:hypothetical protein
MRAGGRTFCPQIPPTLQPTGVSDLRRKERGSCRAPRGRDGVLTIRIPKIEKAMRKKIEVRS